MGPAVEALTVQAVLAVVGAAPYRAGLVEEAAGAVDACVQRGIPASRVMNAFRLLHELLADALMEAVCEHGAPHETHTELRRVAGVLHRHMNQVADELVEAYRLADQAWQSSAAAEVAGLVDAILANESVDPEDASRVLRYPLQRQHVAMVVVRRPGSGARDSLRTVLRRWLDRQGNPPALVLARGSGLWVWVAPRSGADALAELLASCPVELQVAVGTPGSGLKGFRLGHVEACAAADLLACTAAPALSYGDVELELLLGADRVRADTFVRRELRDLADPERADLRRTLAVYLSEGRSVARTAGRLYIARNTVSYRVNRAVELLGRDLADRRLELECALRLADEDGVARRPSGAPPR